MVINNKPRLQKKGSNSFRIDQQKMKSSGDKSKRGQDLSSQIESLKSLCDRNPSPEGSHDENSKRVKIKADTWEKHVICSWNNNKECECKNDSENNSHFIWTSENDNPNQYDSIDEKFENSRISTKGITKYSSNEEAKNVSYELDLGNRLKIDDIVPARDRLNSEPDRSLHFLSNKKNTHRRTLETRYDLNSSLNAQLGEANSNNQEVNEPIVEEEEGINDDPEYFYMSTSEEFKPKETFHMIR